MERIKGYETDHISNRPIYGPEEIKKFENAITFLKTDKVYCEIFRAILKGNNDFDEVNFYFHANRLNGPGKKFRRCMDELDKLKLVNGHGGIESRYKGFKKYELTDLGREFEPIFINEVLTTD